MLRRVALARTDVSEELSASWHGVTSQKMPLNTYKVSNILYISYTPLKLDDVQHNTVTSWLPDI
jgi:hypothetical protein